MALLGATNKLTLHDHISGKKLRIQTFFEVDVFEFFGGCLSLIIDVEGFYFAREDK